MKKKILACLLILFPILSLGVAKADTEKTKYVIASDSSFAPFVFQDSSNQYTGIDMDLIKVLMLLLTQSNLDKQTVSLQVCQ